MHAHGAWALELGGGGNGDPPLVACRAFFRHGTRSSCPRRLLKGHQSTQIDFWTESSIATHWWAALRCPRRPARGPGRHEHACRPLHARLLRFAGCSPFCPILSHFVPSRQARPDGQQRVQPAQEQGDPTNGPHHRPRRQQDGHRRRCWRAARVGRRPPRRPRPRLRRPPEPTVVGPWWRLGGLERAQDRSHSPHRRPRGREDGQVGAWPRL